MKWTKFVNEYGTVVILLGISINLGYNWDKFINNDIFLVLMWSTHTMWVKFLDLGMHQMLLKGNDIK